MAALAAEIATRFQVHLDPIWCSWFDHPSPESLLCGAFQTAVSVEALFADQPSAIWPGLMLPDTLPVIGNEYGDWICARVCSNDHFVELLHWYHGGGDWIPVGRSLVEAVMHDVADSLRPSGLQMLRGASETIQLSDHQDFASPLTRVLSDPWYANSLDCLASAAGNPWNPQSVLSSFLESLQKSSYHTALDILERAGLCTEAVACDQIERLLQTPLTAIASHEVAAAIGSDWSPDFVRALFDLSVVDEERRADICHHAGLTQDQWPFQDWESAEQYALKIIARRSDLAWAYDIAGWAAQRDGRFDAAMKVYWRGRHASPFTDQSVRIRSHWYPERFCKFSISQIVALSDQLNSGLFRDPYLDLFQTPSFDAQDVAEYWLHLGELAMRENRYAEAYDLFYRAGWDLGVRQLAGYFPILTRLAEAAEAAGFRARAAVALTHLACLEDRIR
ncbi:MAG: hypothetical protein KDB22_17765 [Planctomycetales bacterium]|nr:hypothetical protein [Planctomycetales bacterium]